MISELSHDIENTFPESGRGLNYLIIAPRVSLLPYPQNLEAGIPVLPLGMAYVSSSIKQIHKKVFNLNLEFATVTIREAIKDAICNNNIDVVLTGGLSFQFSRVKEIVDIVKSINKNIITVVGGGIITSAPKIAMKAFECVDLGVVGEGEITARELVIALNSGSDVKNVDGIVYKENGNFILTEPRQEIDKLDTLPLPDYVGLGFDRFWKEIDKSAMLIGSRSCPFHCSFCFHPTGKKYRLRSIDDIISEIDYLVNNYSVKSIGFLEELLVSNRPRLEEFCRKIKPYKLRWAGTAHAATFISDMLPLMRESGCHQISFGIESACDNVLKSMNKKTTFSQIESALKITYDNDLTPQGAFIFGDIAEDSQTVDKTIRWWRENRKYHIDLLRVRVFPGTQLYDHAVKNGVIDDEVKYLSGNCPHINVSRLTDREYKQMSLRLTTEEALHACSCDKFEILDVDLDNQKTFLKLKCFCGYEAKVWTRGILLSSNIFYPMCNRRYILPLHIEYSMECVNNVVSSLIRNYGQIAFWGLGREMQVLLHKTEICSYNDIFIIDKDEYKQGLLFMNKSIHGPKLLLDENVRIVIPTPILSIGLHYMETIEAEVLNLNGSVKIVQFGELLERNGFAKQAVGAN